MKKNIKRLFIVTLVLIVLVIGLVVFKVFTRDRPEVAASTLHPELSRESCIECHEPIAKEWRQSFHYLSVTGPFWQRIRTKGYATLFETLRVPCMNCHAPANVLDLAAGEYPAVRTDSLQLGVDCVACHVSERGIVGPGRAIDAPHEVHADDRFQNPSVSSTMLCGHCHEEPHDQGKVVTAWQRSGFAQEGITCLDCHMPMIEAPSVAGGSARLRRSHRFLGDKDSTMLSTALNASIVITEDKQAIVRIVNDRVGHAFPAAGTNWLLVRIVVRDEAGRIASQLERGFGTIEFIPGYLDFWPFLQDSKIPYGEHREIIVPLQSNHGHVSAEFRYRDWFAITDRDAVFATLTEDY